MENLITTQELTPGGKPLIIDKTLLHLVTQIMTFKHEQCDCSTCNFGGFMNTFRETRLMMATEGKSINPHDVTAKGRLNFLMFGILGIRFCELVRSTDITPGDNMDAVIQITKSINGFKMINPNSFRIRDLFFSQEDFTDSVNDAFQITELDKKHQTVKMTDITTNRHYFLSLNFLLFSAGVIARQYGIKPIYRMNDIPVFWEDKTPCKKNPAFTEIDQAYAYWISDTEFPTKWLQYYAFYYESDRNHYRGMRFVCTLDRFLGQVKHFYPTIYKQLTIIGCLKSSNHIHELRKSFLEEVEKIKTEEKEKEAAQLRAREIRNSKKGFLNCHETVRDEDGIFTPIFDFSKVTISLLAQSKLTSEDRRLLNYHLERIRILQLERKPLLNNKLWKEMMLMLGKFDHGETERLKEMATDIEEFLLKLSDKYEMEPKVILVFEETKTYASRVDF